MRREIRRDRKTANALRGLVLVDEGLDWILIVTILAQRDDGVCTSPKGGYDCLSIWWHRMSIA